MTSRIKLGVITDEFFEPSLGRLGGFGWAARKLARIFTDDPSLGVDVVYIAGEHRAQPGTPEATAHGCRVILRQPTRLANLRNMRREQFDLLLTIDYNLGYSVYLRSLPRTPAIVWVRDPRTPHDVARLESVRIPDAQGDIPQGLFHHETRSLARIASESRWMGRKLMLASPAPHLVAKLEDTYGFEPWDFFFLPNPVQLRPPSITKSEFPTVVFLARLDPVKRPWLFVELATHYPDVEFRFLGQSHFTGTGSWDSSGLPDNVRLLGHVGEQEKLTLLSEAWVAVNTSVHEGLAVSMLEALACQTPLLSCVNTAFVVSRFGMHTGYVDGDGREAMGALCEGLTTLLTDHERRRTLGQRGQAWVLATHSRESFLERFYGLCALAGVRR